MFFVKIIRILAYLISLSVIFYIVKRAVIKKTKVRFMQQSGNGRTKRKYVKSHIVEQANNSCDRTS